MNKEEQKKLLQELKEKRCRSLLKNNKLIGFIPARGGSKGVPRKNVLVVGGYPLIARSILSLFAAGLETVWVSTDDPEIKSISLKYGAKVLDRPRYLSGDLVSTEAVVAHFFQNVMCNQIILVQTTSPLLNAQDIYSGIVKFFLGGYDSLFSAVKENDILFWNSKLKPVNYNPKKRGTRQTRKEYVLIESGGFFIFTKQIFKKEHCRLGGKIGFSLVPFWRSFQLDTKQDLIHIRKLLEK